MELSNWINLGILLVTALVGILVWLATRNSAREAHAYQREANAAAVRSASAAEEATKLQRRMVEIENLRQTDAALDANRASLHAEITTRQAIRAGGPRQEQHLAVVNSGQACATHLQIRINNKPIGEYSEIQTPLAEDASIGPRGKLELLFKPRLDPGSLQRPFNVELTWDHASGTPGTWQGTV